MASSSSNPRGLTGDFETFFEGWLVHQEHYLEELQSVLENVEESSVDYLKDLAARVTFHYQEYYKEKSRLLPSNVFLVLDPPWFTPFEKSLFWVAGFNPLSCFKVVAEAVNDLTVEQSQKIEQLKNETKSAQRYLSCELARIQETVGGYVISTYARNVSFRFNESEMDTALETLRSDLVTVVTSADEVRSWIADQVAQILNPIQNVKFLAAVSKLQLRARRAGLEMEARTRNRISI